MAGPAMTSTLFISRVTREVPLEMQHFASVPIDGRTARSLSRVLGRLSHWAEENGMVVEVEPERDHEGHRYFRIRDCVGDLLFFAVVATQTSADAGEMPKCQHKPAWIDYQAGHAKCKYCKAIYQHKRREAPQQEKK